MQVVMPLILVISLLVGPVAQAGAPRHSPRPMPRETIQAKTDFIQVFYRNGIRPKPRFEQSSKTPMQTASSNETDFGGRTTDYVLATTQPIYRSPRPEIRPEDLNLNRTIVRQVKTKPTAQGTRIASTNATATYKNGALCGDRRIRGEVLAPIGSSTTGCGIASPVRVTSIDGITLSQGSIMDCTTAKTLAGWLTDSVRPAVGRRGGGLQSVRVAAHYSCRTRNSQKGAKISEHGKGHAIDISGLMLANGRMITVKEGWLNRKDNKILAAVRAKACGPFGTVLGPGSDRFHSDHFHLDTARYRSGSYCK